MQKNGAKRIQRNFSLTARRQNIKLKQQQPKRDIARKIRLKLLSNSAVTVWRIARRERSTQRNGLRKIQNIPRSGARNGGWKIQKNIAIRTGQVTSVVVEQSDHIPQ